MTATLESMTKKKPEPSAEQLAAEALVRRARGQALSPTGPDGLLKQLTKVNRQERWPMRWKPA